MDFRGANLSGAQILNVDLSKACSITRTCPTSTFANTDLTGANFSNADLIGVNFQKADLSKARLDKADLTDAKFLDADLTDANISEANLSGVRFSNDGLQAAKGLTHTQIDQARADPDNPPKIRRRS